MSWTAPEILSVLDLWPAPAGMRLCRHYDVRTRALWISLRTETGCHVDFAMVQKWPACHLLPLLDLAAVHLMASHGACSYERPMLKRLDRGYRQFYRGIARARVGGKCAKDEI